MPYPSCRADDQRRNAVINASRDKREPRMPGTELTESDAETNVIGGETSEGAVSVQISIIEKGEKKATNGEWQARRERLKYGRGIRYGETNVTRRSSMTSTAEIGVGQKENCSQEKPPPRAQPSTKRPMRREPLVMTALPSPPTEGGLRRSVLRANVIAPSFAILAASMVAGRYRAFGSGAAVHIPEPTLAAVPEVHLDVVVLFF